MKTIYYLLIVFIVTTVVLFYLSGNFTEKIKPTLSSGSENDRSQPSATSAVNGISSPSGFRGPTGQPGTGFIGPKGPPPNY